MRTSAFVAALLVGLAVRLAALPLPGTDTVGTLKIWSVAGSGDVSTLYGSQGVPAPAIHWQGRAARIDAPPAALYELGLVGRLYRAYDPAFQDGRWLGLLIKLPGLLAGAILTVLLYSVVRQRTGRDVLARWAALACWLNPALVLNGDALGSLDPLVHLPAIAALLLAHVEAPFAAGLMAAVAVLTDPQGLLVLPALVVALVALRGSGGMLRAIAGMAIAAAVLLLPFMSSGALRGLWAACGLPAWLEQPESIDAANLWWLGGWALSVLPFLKGEGILALLRSPARRPSVLDRLRRLRVPHPRLLSAAAAAFFVVRACWQTRDSRSLALHAAVAAFTVQSYFVLAAGARAHQQVLAIPLLALAAGLRPQLRGLLYTLSTLAVLNLTLFYGIGNGAAWMPPRTLFGLDLAVPLALANLVVFVAFASQLGDEALAERTARYTPYEAAVT